jgi:hypothetical protein
MNIFHENAGTPLQVSNVLSITERVKYTDIITPSSLLYLFTTGGVLTIKLYESE